MEQDMTERAYKVTITPVGPDDYSCDFTIKSHDDADYVVGHVKWDGCMNWNLPDQHYNHFCAENEAADLAWAFREAWRLCAAELGDKYDLGAPLPVD